MVCFIDLEKLLSQEGLVARLKEPEKIAVSPVDNTVVSFTQLNEQGILNRTVVDSAATKDDICPGLACNEVKLLCYNT